MADLLSQATILRQTAWDAVKASAEYGVFRALDDVVVAAGGSSLLARKPAPETVPVRRRERSKASNADVAERVLRIHGSPLPIGRFLELSLAAGAQIGGDDPLPNFRSTLSRDKRFKSVSRNNMYFWWFDNEALPPDWNATGVAAPVAYLPFNQKGGDDHAAKTN